MPSSSLTLNGSIPRSKGSIRKKGPAASGAKCFESHSQSVGRCHSAGIRICVGCGTATLAGIPDVIHKQSLSSLWVIFAAIDSMVRLARVGCRPSIVSLSPSKTTYPAHHTVRSLHCDTAAPALKSSGSPFRQSFRVTKYYLRPPLVEKYLSRETNLLSPQRSFGLAEFRPVVPKDDAREDLIGVWLAEVEEGRRSRCLSRVGRRGNQPTHGGGLTDV